MRPRFVVQEIITGLRRNLTMTIAVVVTVMIALSLLGAALLATRVADRMNQRFLGDLEVSIYLQQDVTQSQTDALRQQLATDPRVEKFTFITKEQAAQRAKEVFKDQPDLQRAVSGQDILPESFAVKLKNPKQFEDIASRYANAAGVDQVNDQKRLLQPLFDLLDGVKTVAVIIAIVSGAAALLTTFNTIRLAAFSRRREIGIMRLVGAGNFTIQLPFVLEGVIAGLVGAGAAVGLLAIFKNWVLDGTLHSFFANNVIPNAEWHDVWAVTPWLAGLGIFVAAAASYVTSLLYVRV